MGTINGSVDATGVYLAQNRECTMEALEETLRFSRIPPVMGPTHKPRSVSETGVRQAVLEDLALKTLYLSGPFSVYGLADHTRLSFEVANELFSRLREQQFCHVT